MRKTTTTQKIPFPAPDVLTKVIPAPVEGWDAISPLADMSPQRAVALDNFVARPGYIEVRKGFVTWVTTSVTVPIETMMVYNQPSTVTLYAASQNGILFNVTASLTTGATVVASVYTTGRFQYTNFTPGNGSTVIQFVNGTDSLQQISGTVISSVAITGLTIVATGAVTTNNFSNIHAQKRRLWYVVKNSTIAVFMPTDAITGAIAGYQDNGALWDRGGYLVAVGSWTIDGGAGPTDYVVFISSEGQLTIYSGVDPTSAADWQLKGTFTVAKPIGKRCFLRFGSDLLLITQAGVIPISQALPFDPSADRSTALTSRIQNAMATAAASYGSNFGWELTSYPPQNLLVLNVPITEENTQYQYVMNTLTGAWSRFLGWNANTFAVANNNLYFGDNVGQIRLAYTSGADNGTTITAHLKTAFNWFDNPGRLKRMTMMQPLLTVDGDTATISVGISQDFGVSQDCNDGVITTAAATTLWDVSLWDTGTWLAATTIAPWLSVNGLGKNLAIKMHIVYNSTSQTTPPIVQVNAFNSILEMGGLI